MAHSHDVHHDYHLVNPSPWPVVGSVAVLILAIGAVVAMRGLAQPSDAADFGAQLGNAILIKGKMWLLGLGALGLSNELGGRQRDQPLACCPSGVAKLDTNFDRITRTRRA